MPAVKIDEYLQQLYYINSKTEPNMDSKTLATINSESESEHSRNSRFEIIRNDATVSTRRFNLSDARTILAYVQRKMKQQEKNKDDNKIKVPNAVLSALAGKTTCKKYAQRTAETDLSNASKETLKDYMSFVEHSSSVYLPEDGHDAAVTEDIQVKHDKQQVKVPPLPPTKPPPLQLHIPTSNNHTGHDQRSKSPLPSHQKQENDNVESTITHVEISNMSLVVLDIESPGQDSFLATFE